MGGPIGGCIDVLIVAHGHHRTVKRLESQSGVVESKDGDGESGMFSSRS